MKINQKPFWYLTYQGTAPYKDDDGYETGEVIIKYSKPKLAMGNISAADGEAQIEQIGKSVDYTKIIFIEGEDTPIDENSVLFVGKKPEFDEELNPLYNYVVVKKAPSLTNHILLAIKQVE